MSNRETARSWKPSALGKHVTKSRDWHLELNSSALTGAELTGTELTGTVRNPPELTISVEGDTLVHKVSSFGGVSVTPGRLWAHIELEHADRRFRFRGIPNRRAASFLESFVNAQAEAQHALRLLELIEEFDHAATQVRLFTEALATAIAVHLKTKGWLTTEFSADWAARKAAVGFGGLLDHPDLQAHIGTLSAVARHTVTIWQEDLGEFIKTQNERHLEAELDDCHEFFDTVEKSPLTPEQARAVVCFDNRMLVVASAGSGKTSTMVAKAGYALHRHLIPADQILMLAFNAAAAKELQTRTRERLAPLGLDADKVVAKTFHAFGLEIIGQATGRKPSLAPWLSNGGDLAQLGRIVERLRSANPSFRAHWDFFRAVLANDYSEIDPEDGSETDPENLVYRTSQGEVVRSHGEQTIANWLFFNGVDYVYERPYERDTVDAEHGQYRPDFYYPRIKAYHEHWGLDAHGAAPKEFDGYLDGVRWKRALHRQHGTTLLETTTAELWSGKAIPQLARELTERGIRLNPDPERVGVGPKPLENASLIQTFRTFLIHTKSNRLIDEQLTERLHAHAEGQIRYRDTAFLRLFTAIRREWDAMLTADGCIDFEDMLTLSADHLEAGDWQSPYKLVMVDEFQDASNARARLAQTLVAQPGRYLFAVGDDWQSINRFAGADLSVMTGFERWFGPSETLRLERTFRFPQSIADVSSRFVLQNPSQISKTVVSSTAEHPPTIGAVSVNSDTAIKAAIHHWLKALHTQIARGRIPQPVGVKVTVFILGRYRHQSEWLPGCSDLADLLDVKFMTIHGSKGVEADYIVIPGMVTGKWGFPSTIPNDPVLRLAMPGAEDFPRAEERRLFYVAMTRARRGVLLVTVKNKESPFLLELVRDHGVVRTDAVGEVLESVVCPKCGRALMVARTSKRGAFLGCRRYPRCKGTLSRP